MHLTPADRLEVLVLIDNTTDFLSSVPPIVTGELARLLRHRISPTRGSVYCCAAHGLSLLITAHGPQGPRTMLFDAGPADDPIEMNASRLGVDFGTIDAITLSHSHWDHAGGLARALAMIHAAGDDHPVPLYLHPAMFQERAFRLPGGRIAPAEPFPTPQRWSDLGAEPRVTTEAVTCLDDLFYVSGEIPRMTAYEKGFDQNVHRSSPDLPWEPEPLVVDERFVAVHVRDKGMVVFSGCSHAGIVNILHHARTCFPGTRLHAVMGGFHLAGPSEALIPDTVRDLGTFGLNHIMTGHCTGWRALSALQGAFGDQVVAPLGVGKLFSL